MGTDGDDVLHGTEADDVISGLGGNDRLIGGGGSDAICGGRGNDTLEAGEGLDWLIPGPGRDEVSGGSDEHNVVSYFPSASAITIDLRSGIARGQGRDIVRNVHQIVGSRFDDVMIGNARGNALIGFGGDDTIRGGRGDDSLIGGRGDDTLVGGRGPDYAAFIDSPGAVDVRLAAGTATGEGDDTLRGLENVFGSRYNDVLIGTSGDNEFIGGIAGDDEIIGRGGSDFIYRVYGAATISAGAGRDEVLYEFPGTIDLTTGTAVGTDYSDSLTGVEDVRGGGGRHVIVGDDSSNELAGGRGRDVIKGGAGDDTISGEGGDDVLTGGEGTDEIHGGGGEDACLEGESVSSCEQSILAVERTFDAVSGKPASFPRRWRCGPTVPRLVSRLGLQCPFGLDQEQL